MANKNPNQAGLAKGRGKRPRLGHKTVPIRMSKQTEERLKQYASVYKCLYGGKPWMSGLMEKLGKGELIIVPAPPSLPDNRSIDAIELD